MNETHNHAKEKHKIYSDIRKRNELKSDIVVPLMDWVEWWSGIGQNKSWKLLGVILFYYYFYFFTVFILPIWDNIEFALAQHRQNSVSEMDI